MKSFSLSVFLQLHVFRPLSLEWPSWSPLVLLPAGAVMSAAQTQKEVAEAGWGCLESLGLSQKELVLAEALQMEYDALSRIKQDRGAGGSVGGAGAGVGAGYVPTRSKIPNPSIQRPRPVPPPSGDSLLRGLSGSDSSLHQTPPSLPPRLAPPPATTLQSKDSVYILDSQGSQSTSDFPSKGSTLFPDDIPPAIPPRNPLPPGGAMLDNPFLPPRVSTLAPPTRDVNLFLPDLDPPKVGGAELNYDTINQSLAQLNGGRRAREDQLGKPVARSKTLPPQVPPRTYVPAPKSNKNQRRVSADPVRGHGSKGGSARVRCIWVKVCV